MQTSLTKSLTAVFKLYAVLNKQWTTPDTPRSCSVVSAGTAL